MADRFFTKPLVRRSVGVSPGAEQLVPEYNLPVETIDPIHLTAVATDVQANSDAGTNALALKNTTPYPMEIHEIKFDLLSPSTNIHGGTVGCKLEFGGIPLTNGYVPLLSFGRTLNLLGAELLRDTNGTDVDVTTSLREYVWKLPQPIYVPPKGTIVPAMKHLGYIKTALDMRVSYSGRLLPRGYTPPSYKVPWVTAFVSKAFSVGLGADSDQSDEDDLSNPFDTEVHVQRFIGRTAGFDPDSANVPVLDHPDSVARQLRIRMDDSSGDPLIPNFAPLASVFPLVLRGSWDVDAVMRPCSYFMAYLDLVTGPGGEGGQLLECLNQAFISLVGWRTIQGY